MSPSLFKKLSSLRLTLALLFALAAFACAGTLGLVPQGLPPAEYAARLGAFGRFVTLAGLDDYYRSWPCRGLFLLLMANLLACGAARSIEGFRNALGRGRPSVTLPPGEDREGLLARLSGAGFTVADDKTVRAGKRRWAFLGFPLVHLSPFLIVAGGFWGTEGGMLATGKIAVGAVESSFYDWRGTGEAELPFAVQAAAFRRLWYPLRLRLALSTPDGLPHGEVEVMEGERFRVPGTPLEVVVEKVDPEAQGIAYRVYSPGGASALYTGRDLNTAPVTFSSMRWKGEERNAEARLVFFDKEKRVVAEETVWINNPAVVLGYRVFLTAWGKDEKGEPYVGLQITRDPGQNLVWAGSVLLVAGVFLLLFVEGAWVEERDGRLEGRSTRGRKSFAALLAGSAEKGEGDENG